MDKLKAFYSEFKMDKGSVGYADDGVPDYGDAIILGFRIVMGGFSLALLMLMVGITLASHDEAQLGIALVGGAFISYLILNWIWNDDLFIFSTLITVISAAAICFAALASDPDQANNIFGQILLVSIMPGLAATVALYTMRVVFKWGMVAIRLWYDASTPTSEPQEEAA